MALRIPLPATPSLRFASPPASPGSVALLDLPRRLGGGYGGRVSTGGAGRRRVVVRTSVELAAVPGVGRVTEVNKDTFWPLVEASGEKVVVLDMYTQWCGPCKMMAPKFKELSEKYNDVVFLKLDCNQENRPLAKELGLKVVPTFKIFKDSEVVKEVRGAKYDDLVFAIETLKSS